MRGQDDGRHGRLCLCHRDYLVAFPFDAASFNVLVLVCVCASMSMFLLCCLFIYFFVIADDTTHDRVVHDYWSCKGESYHSVMLYGASYTDLVHSIFSFLET